MEYDNTSRGVLFKNDRKDKESQPDYKGSYTDGSGQEFWLSAWLKKDKNGNTFMSLSTTAKDDAHSRGMQQVRQSAKPTQELEDDLPF